MRRGKNTFFIYEIGDIFCAAFITLTSRSPLQLRFWTGGMNLRSPRGGSANGILAHTSTLEIKWYSAFMWSTVFHWNWPNHHYFFPYHSIHLSIFTSYPFLLMKFNFEVSLTSLLRELNFLSPLTRPADVLTTSSWSNIFLKTRIIDVFSSRSRIKNFQIVLD